MAKRRFRFILLFGLLAVVLSVVVAVCGGYGMLRANPAWYSRVKLTADQQAEGQRQLLDHLAVLHNAVGQSQVHVQRGNASEFPPFEVRITEDEVNGAMTRWYDANAGFRAALGEVAEPHVRFIKDRVEVAGRSAKFDSLISIELSVEHDAATGAPAVTLGRPYAGRLPLSRSLINAPQTVAKLRAGNGDGVLPEEFLAALERLLSGDPVSPPIVAVSSSYNGERLLPARVEKLSIDGGTLIATLRPFLPTTPTPTTRKSEPKPH